MKKANKPLTKHEQSILEAEGWEFTGIDFMHIPDDYDGCMASGISSIRLILERTKAKNKRERESRNN